MEVVRVFNNELSSLYEAKPPISKAKMTQITKTAIKGIKFYKHVVQSVEKFIQKCRPEYKVPGLYVIDSIVRQSRHQFGAEKDVFGPRFVKNIVPTFQHLFKCSEEDRSRIIRVLNLWQKNNVFPIDIIQPLLDMGHPNTTAETFPSEDNQISSNQRHKESDSSHWKNWPQGNEEPPPSDNRTYAEMSTKNLEKFTKAEMTLAVEESSRTAILRNQLAEDTVKFNKKLLDFDYGDEEDEEDAKNDDNQLPDHPTALALSMAQNLLSNPELLRQLQQMQQTIQQNEAFNSELSLNSKPDENEVDFSANSNGSPLQPPSYQQPNLPTSLPPNDADKDDRMLHQPPLPPQDLDERSLASIMTPHRPSSQLQYQEVNNMPVEGDKDDRIIPTVPVQDLDERSVSAILAPLNKGGMPPIPYPEPPYPNNAGFPLQQPSLPHMEPPMAMEGGAYPPSMPPDRMAVDEDERVMYNMPGEPPLPPQDFDERSAKHKEERSSRRERSRSRSAERSRGRSSRRRSRSRSPRRRRSRSRSHSRKTSDRAKERERRSEKEKEREKERERKRKGLPTIKKDSVSVCSRTIWMGHIPKSSTESDIRKAFEEYGTVTSVDIIPPRGCAYVVMSRRQDGYRALQKLKNLKIHGSVVKMAWAPGKGVKGKEFKEYWEVEAGVSYIPFSKIASEPDFLNFLEEGGSFDEESFPDHIKALRVKPDDQTALSSNQVNPVPVTTAFNPLQPHAPPMVPPTIIPPSPVGVPIVMPHLMQPQFGLPLPGLLPPHQSMVMQVPMGIPPPNPMLMVQQQTPNLLANQALSLVGGLPAMVPRSLPTIPTNAMQGLKNADPATGSPMIPTAAAGDATPTEEDGTSITPPNTTAVNLPVPPSVSQFNPMLGLSNVTRNMLPVLQSASTSGAPIPFPPPQGGFGFPPPGMRLPGGHGMAQVGPYGWPAKPPMPFSDKNSSQSRTMLGQPGISPHTFSSIPPMPDGAPKENLSQDKMSDADSRGNDKPQEMVISTDDEASVDHEYQQNDMPMAAAFPSMGDFGRGHMHMHRMRGPMIGSRFPHPGMHMFPPQMGGPRGHDMHDFNPHGARVPDMHREGPQQDYHREWYPRDFEGPPQDRNRRDSRRSPGAGDSDPRWDNGRRDRNFEGDRHGFDNDRHGGYSDRRDNRDDRRGSYGNRDSDKNAPPEGVLRPRPPREQKPPKGLADDLFKLKFYQREKKPSVQSYLQKQLEKKKAKDEEMKDKNKFTENSPNQTLQSDANISNPTSAEINLMASSNDIAKRERDREARKRSRWGRTHSEEREFQEQRRNEIEMKIRGYEKESQSIIQNNATAPGAPVAETADVLMADVCALENHIEMQGGVSDQTDSTPVNEASLPIPSEMPPFEGVDGSLTNDNNNSEFNVIDNVQSGETCFRNVDDKLPNSPNIVATEFIEGSNACDTPVTSSDIDPNTIFTPVSKLDESVLTNKEDEVQIGDFQNNITPLNEIDNVHNENTAPLNSPEN